MALVDNCVAAYHLDEASGDALDAVGSNDLTNSGITQGSTGKLSDCYTYDGGTGDGTVGTSALNGSTTWSVMGWFKSTVTGGNYDPIFDVNSDGFSGNGGTALCLQPTTKKLIILNEAVGVSSASSSAYNDGSWHSFMLTRNGSQYYVYVDGSSSAVISYSNAGGEFGQYLKIGGRTDSAASFNGQIDEICLFNAVKSTTDYATFHNSGSGLAYPFSSDVTVNPSALSISTDNAEPVYLFSATMLALDSSISVISPSIEGATLAMNAGTVTVGTGTISTRYITTEWPMTEGLELGTTKIDGRIANLVATEGSNVPIKERVGL